MDITLALGGGGSRGYAHIGVIRRLEQEGFRIKAIAGTSFGGIVGVLYAAGYRPNDLEEMFCALDQKRLYGHAPEDGPSLIGLAGVRQQLINILGDRTFDSLRMPFAVTATDLKSGSEVVLTSGLLLDAILATIAMPGIFPARHIGDFELVDGGTLDPVPVVPARALAPRLPVVAVSLTLPMGSAARYLVRSSPGLCAACPDRPVQPDALRTGAGCRPALHGYLRPSDDSLPSRGGQTGCDHPSPGRKY